MISISQRIAALSPEKRELLLRRLKTTASQEQYGSRPVQGQAPPLRAYERSASTHLPLSFAQQRLWFLDQLESGNTAYLLPGVYQLRGLLDVQCFEQSLAQLVQRHESLRTTFAMDGDQPVQVIHPALCSVPVIDLQRLNAEERVAQHQQLAAQEAHHPCNLERGPLLRLHLLRLTSEEHILLLTMHHMITDGWSMDILVRELSELYRASVERQPASLSALPIQYVDYALWQRRWLQGEVLQQQLDYWTQQLAGAPPMLNMPTDRPRPPMQTSHGAWQSRLLSSALHEQLKSLSRAEHVTLFMIGLAAFQVLLMRYSGESDMVVGIPAANRGREELEYVIGFFANTLALRTDLAGNPSFQDLLIRVRETVLDAYAHQDLPFEKLVEELQLERDLSRHPLFQVFFVLQNTPFANLELPGISCHPLEPPNQAVRFDLSLMLVEMESGLLTVAEYNTDLFDGTTITRLLNHWQVLLEAIVRDPSQPIAMLSLLTEPEMQRFLVEWNHTACNIPDDVCLHHLIEQQVQQTPEAIAVICEQALSDHNPYVLTYGELNARANQLARRLQAIGIGPDKLVAICMERSLELLVALFAILKAGGAYIPLDPAYPPERLARMLADAQPAVVLTQQRLLTRLPKHGLFTSNDSAHVLCVDREWRALAEKSRSNLVNTILPDQTAYVIYTSGSTGAPRGVMVSHHNVANFFRGMDEHIGDPIPGIWLAITSISFDISILELFWTLTRGFQVVLYADKAAPNTIAERTATVGIPTKKLAFSLFYFASDAVEQTANSYQLLLEGAKFADQHGFQAVWTPERHFHAFGGLYPNPSVTGAAVAAVTQHIQIRAGSVVLPLHNPIRVAEEWAVVDNLSCGRVGLAFASGWHANDFVFAPDKYAQRRELMRQDIETVRKLWRGESITVQGGTGQNVAVRTMPRPVQAELPVWITSAGSSETFRMAGEAGVNVLTHLLGQDLDQLAAKIAVYREAWHQHGHDAQGHAGHVTLMVHTFIGTDLPAVRETVRQPFRAYLRSSIDLLQGLAQSLGLDINADSFHQDDMEALLDHAFERYFATSGLMGTVDSCLPMIESLQAIGVDELACLIDFGVAVDDVLASLQRLQELKERSQARKEYAPTERDMSLSAQLLEYGVSHLQCTPSLMHMLLLDPLATTALQRLSHILLGGEELPLALVKEIQTRIGTSSIQLHNMYGPTETTIWSTTSVIEPDKGISLGVPIANTQVYLLDTHLQPVPMGVAGEIYIGGKGLAHGYLHQAALTAERFLPNPWDTSGGGRLYRTGDRAGYHQNGRLEYLGRGDQQVKLRGYRIELGEIEACLRAYPAIHEAVVLLIEEGQHRSEAPSLQKYLLAYVVAEGEERPTQDDLRAHLRRQLPPYMVPANILFLEKLPLTPNGKVDRQALPIGVELALPSEMGPLQTPLQVQLAMIWAELLHVPQVGLHSNFFELGGHSLLAAQLMLRMQSAFGVKVALRRLFEAPTLSEMAEVIEQMQNEIGEQEERSQLTIVPRNREIEATPLSFAQERLWFLDQLAPNSSSYVVSQPFHLSGPLQVEALERSLAAVVQRHEILRTTFPAQEGRPIQLIAPHLVLQVPVIDLSGLLATERDQPTKRLVQHDAHRPFDLAHGPLLRLHLLRSTMQAHVLLFTLHHIISDGKWSMSILVRELSALYQSELTEGKPVRLPALPIQYADYAIWQRRWLQGEVLEGQLAYWQQQLVGLSGGSIQLPTDRPRPAVQTDAGAQQSLLLPPTLLQELKRLSLEAGVTLFMTLLAAFQVLLMRYSGQQDIAVGTPIAGRQQAGLENLIGFFVNTLVLRTDLAGNPSFRQALTRVREVALQAYAHQDVPFEKLVDALQVERSLSHSPLFQVFFVLQNAPTPDATLTSITFRQLAREHFTSLFDLSLELIEEERGLLTLVEYSTDLFDASTIERLLGHWQVLLEAIVRNPEQQIERLPLLTEVESHRLLAEWNNTTKSVPLDLCLHHLFEQQVEQTPEVIAIVFEEQQITYQQLNNQANQLAHRLQRLGVGPDVLVGVCMERSVELVVAVLAILKAGGAYVPLDPSYPAERLAWMLKDALPVVVLTQTHLIESLPTAHGQHICLDVAWEHAMQMPTHNPTSIAVPQNLAYMIYTSGTTGRPKGVMNTHRSLCNRLLWMQQTYQLTAQDRILQKTPFSFDVSIWEFFWSLITGARLIMALPGGHQDPSYLRKLIAQQQVTRLHFVPSMLQAFLWEDPTDHQPTPQSDTSLRQVFCSGEALSVALQARFFACFAEEVELHNLYGPTEAAIDVTFWPCPRRIGASPQLEWSVPIGRPITNTQIYVLDRNLQPAPIGVPGELYIGGLNLARGYQNRMDLTAERFIPHPFAGTGSTQGTNPTAPVFLGERLCRTGDLARYRADGAIEYLGRIDHQIKLRGFRIELGEIETTLQAHPAVKEAVVVLREEDETRKYLVAYVVARADVGGQGDVLPTLTSSALQEYLREQLPDYMIPTSVVFLETIPLTPNGKVDRKALPVPDWGQLSNSREMVAPQTPLQEQLAIIWAELLHVPQVGIHHNFFELGGHSLLATQLMARIRTIFQVELPLRRLFETSTIAGIALAIEQIQIEQIEQEESRVLAQMFSELGGLSEDDMQEVFADNVE